MTDHSEALFSTEVVEDLSRALNQFLASGGPLLHAALWNALKALCTEAHARKLRPEQVLAQVEGIWQRSPLLASMHETRADVAWNNVVSVCLTAYFADAHWSS